MKNDKQKKRKRFIFTTLEILAVLLLLAPAYRLACGIGLKKTIPETVLPYMPMALGIKRRPSRWQKRFGHSCWRLIAIILQKFLSIFAER